MPELPEVEIVKRSLKNKVNHKKIKKIIITNRNLRFKIPKNFEKALEGKEYLIGDFSGVEFMTGHCCTKLSDLGCVTDDMPNLKAYVERIKSRPAFQKAISTN